MVEISFGGEFLGLSKLVSKSIALNPRTLAGAQAYFVSAMIVISDTAMSDSTALTFTLSANGGSTWEATSVNLLHTFTVTNGTDLRWKVEAVAGTTLTLGHTTPLKIIYTTA